MKIATEYPGQQAIVAVTQQRHFHVTVPGDRWETKGRACCQLWGNHPDPAKGFADACQWLISSTRDAMCWWTWIPFSVVNFSPTILPQLASCLCTHKDAEQRPVGGGCKPIPTTGQSPRQLAGGWGWEGPCNWGVGQNRPEGNIGSVKAYEIHVWCLLNDSL